MDIDRASDPIGILGRCFVQFEQGDHPRQQVRVPRCRRAPPLFSRAQFYFHFAYPAIVTRRRSRRRYELSQSVQGWPEQLSGVSYPQRGLGSNGRDRARESCASRMRTSQRRSIQFDTFASRERKIGDPYVSACVSTETPLIAATYDGPRDLYF